MSKGYTEREIKMLKETWKLRQTGIYTMGEIADRLGVNREALIEALEVWLEAGRPEATVEPSHD